MSKNIGVLITNIGTPENTSVKAIRQYLKEFLSDPRIVKFQRILWWFILRLIILPTRARKSAQAYRLIWTEEGSPLLIISKLQAMKLQKELDKNSDAKFIVALGMHYGKPSIAEALNFLKLHHCSRVVMLPLFPQYSGTTTASAFDAVAKEFSKQQLIPELRMISNYHDDRHYIESMVTQIKKYWHEHGRGVYLLFSFHGIPQDYIMAGDPYLEQCCVTAKTIAQNLLLPNDAWSVAFQSRLGPKTWLKPYCDETLKSLPVKGITSVDVVCPGFSVDCLETLEEIAIRNRNLFLNSGGKVFRYIPALNDQEIHIKALAEIVKKNVTGWIENN